MTKDKTIKKNTYQIYFNKILIFILIIMISGSTFINYKMYMSDRSKDLKTTKLQKLLDESIEKHDISLKLFKSSINDLEDKLKVKKKLKVHPLFIKWVFRNSNKCPEVLCSNITNYIFEEAKYPVLTLSLIQRESAFNPFAKSSVGAKGLGQVMWKIWKNKLIENNIAEHERDLYDWKININATNFIINELYIQHKGNWMKILDHYVGGDNNNYINDIYKNVGILTLIEESNPLVLENVNKISNRE